MTELLKDSGSVAALIAVLTAIAGAYFGYKQAVRVAQETRASSSEVACVARDSSVEIAQIQAQERVWVRLKDTETRCDKCQDDLASRNERVSELLISVAQWKSSSEGNADKLHAAQHLLEETEAVVRAQDVTLREALQKLAILGWLGDELPLVALRELVTRREQDVLVNDQ